MMRFKEFYYLYDVDQIVALVPEEKISKTIILNEGNWVDSGKKDWMVRVDAADPSIPLQRHVHIPLLVGNTQQQKINRLPGTKTKQGMTRDHSMYLLDRLR